MAAEGFVMSHTVANRTLDTHRLLSEIRGASPAKANLKKVEIDRRPAIGAAMRRARKCMDWSLKELAGAIETQTGKSPDEGQLARWESGKERAHTDVLLFLPNYGSQFIIALACANADIDQIDVKTTITIARTA